LSPLLELFQLWINLPGRAKLVSPGCEYCQRKDIPVRKTPGVIMQVPISAIIFNAERMATLP